MSAKSNKSRDQKRKAKLAKRAEKAKKHQPPVQKEKKELTTAEKLSAQLAYKGTKYQKDAWALAVYETELAIYEAIKLSGETLTNDQVEQALVELITEMRDGLPARLPEEEDLYHVQYTEEDPVGFLKWNFRRHWTIYMDGSGEIEEVHWIGILGTLLQSLLVRCEMFGRERGYVVFLVPFLERISSTKKRFASVLANQKRQLSEEEG